MTKISGTSKATASRPTTIKSRTSDAGSFKVGDAKSTKLSSASGASSTAPVGTLSALISLQGDGGSRAKTIAAAQRALQLLDQIQDGLLAGRVRIRDLEALSHAADAKAAHLNRDDEALASIYNDISLRARVELAKLGR